MKTRRNRAASGLATLLLVALPVAACSNGAGNQSSSTPGSNSQSEVEISFLTHWGPEQVTELEAAAEAFSADHDGVTVTVQAVPFANLLTTLRTQGGSESGPTIAGIYDLWLPELARDGLAAPAPDAQKSDITENWPENIVSAASVDDTVHGYPNEVDLYALNYNTALFEEAGINGPPATFDELVETAEKLTDEASGQQGFGIITNWSSGAVHPFLSLAASNGGSFLDDAGQAGVTSANVVAVAELYGKLVESGATVPDMSAANANTTGPYLDNFANGKTGMIIMANWWQSALKDAMGERYADVATAPIPVGPNGEKASSISYSWMTIVNGKASSEKQAVAWEFLNYLNGPDSGEAGSSAMADILMGMGILPSRTSDLEAHQEALSDPFLKTYVDSLADATPFPAVIGGDAAAQALQRQIEALVFGQASPSEAMEAAATEMNRALNQ